MLHCDIVENLSVMPNSEESLEVRIIKKYPNRRLYDTTQSAYITLEGVREMIVEHERFQVIDSKTGKDITRTILLQIIGEQEANDGTPLFSNVFLEQLIRFYGNALQGLMSEYLEKSLQSFMQQQDSLRKQMQNVMEVNPMNIMSQMAQKNMSLWENMMPNKEDEQSGEKNDEKKKDGE